MNVNDSERSAGLLHNAGLEPAMGCEQADIILINTCAVRAKAENKLFSLLGRIRNLKDAHPQMRVIVGGCVAQLHGQSLLRRETVIDAVIGTHRIHRIPALLKRLGEENGVGIVDISRNDSDLFSVPPAIVAHSSRVRAYVTVMEGCNFACSYCVVPRTRGPGRCRSFASIVSEVDDLVSRGFSEVMLLGQAVNAYQWGDRDFADLIESVADIPGLKRLRFTTNHPIHVTRRLAEIIRSRVNLCPQLHLPVQSGSDRVLSSMRRGYSSAEYMDKIKLLRERVPGIAFSTDVIVGYPGESEDDFGQTMRLLADVDFDSLFSFAYSPRPGTVAQTLPDSVPNQIKRRRLNDLNDWQQSRQIARHRNRIGMRESVLVDHVSPDGRLSGRTPHLRIVHFEGPSNLLGKIVNVEITGAGANSLSGRIVEKESFH